MALGRINYKSLDDLLKDQLDTLKIEKDVTIERISLLKEARNRGYLTKSDLESVCHWKSSRAIWLIRKNSSATIKSITREAFSSRDLSKKMELLTSLQGVGVPMASSILMLVHPKRYCVIDIRVWQILYHYHLVDSNPSGLNLSIKNYIECYKVIKSYAKTFNATPRNIEHTLYQYSIDHQKGPLYE